MLEAWLLIFLIAPLSLSAWFCCLLSYTHGSTIELGDAYRPVQPIKLILAILLPIVIVGKGLNSRSLNRSGAVAGLLLGFTLTLINYGFMTSMVVFFLLGSKATKFRGDKKEAFEKDFKKAAERNWVQVFCNGGVALQLSLFYYLEVGCTETMVDFEKYYNPSWWAIGVVASLACSCGDTFASELGTVLPLSAPYLITTMQRVPKGTNGGVSIGGTVASMLGGFAVGVTYYITIIICVPETLLATGPPQWPVIIICTASGLLGSTVDSILGATCQFSGVDGADGRIVERPGPNVTRISGAALLDNHSINFLSSLLVSLTIPRFALYIWWYLSYYSESVPV